MKKKVLFFNLKDPLEKAMRILVEKGFSQAPVIENGKVIGTITESSIIKAMEQHDNCHNILVMDAMDESLPQIPGSLSIDEARNLLNIFSAILIMENGEMVGILTKSDLVNYFI